MIFSTRTKKLEDVSFKINEQNLDIVDSYKYLGLILDEKLSFQKHLYYISGHVSYKLRKLKEIRSYINNSTAVTIFKSLIKPHLDYCDIIWDVAGQTVKSKLQTIQERALSISHNRKLSSNELHKLPKTLPIDLRTEMHLVQHMYNIIKLPTPKFLSCTIKYVSHSHDTRGKKQKKLKLLKPKTESLRKTVYYRAGLAWNKLPSDLRLCTTKQQFIRKTKDYYLERLI